MSYSTSTVIQCWQWKEVIKNRYNYRKGTKSTDPSFFATIFVFTLLLKTPVSKLPMCEYFLASQQALRLNIAVGGRDQARTTIPKLTISNLHKFIQKF